MRPAQTAGTGEKFQHNWVVSVVSGFHELTIRKLRRATTSNSQQTRPRLSSALVEMLSCPPPLLTTLGFV